MGRTPIAQSHGRVPWRGPRRGMEGVPIGNRVRWGGSTARAEQPRRSAEVRQTHSPVRLPSSCIAVSPSSLGPRHRRRGRSVWQGTMCWRLWRHSNHPGVPDGVGGATASRPRRRRPCPTAPVARHQVPLLQGHNRIHGGCYCHNHHVDQWQTRSVAVIGIAACLVHPGPCLCASAIADAVPSSHPDE
jgi:hypothetical protein